MPSTLCCAVDADTIPQLLRLRSMLLRLASALELPPNPLDDLTDRMGGEAAVAELTGRKVGMIGVYGCFWDHADRYMLGSLNIPHCSFIAVVASVGPNTSVSFFKCL